MSFIRLFNLTKRFRHVGVGLLLAFAQTQSFAQNQTDSKAPENHEVPAEQAPTASKKSALINETTKSEEPSQYFSLDQAAKIIQCPDSAVFAGWTCLSDKQQFGPIQSSVMVKVGQNSTILRKAYYLDYSDWSFIKARDLICSLGFVISATEYAGQKIRYSAKRPFFSSEALEEFFEKFESGEPFIKLHLNSPYEQESKGVRFPSPIFQSTVAQLSIVRTEQSEHLFLSFDKERQDNAI